MLLDPYRFGSAATSWFDDFSSSGTLASYTPSADASGATWAISGGTLSASGGSTNQCALLYSGLTFGDGYVESEMTQSDNAGIVGRFFDQANFYIFIVRDASSVIGPNQWDFYRRLGTTFTLINTGSLANWTRGTSRTFRLSLAGTGSGNIALADGGTTLATLSDASISSGKWGVYTYGPLVNQFDSLRIQS